MAPALLVFANKHDLPRAMSPADVTEKLDLPSLMDLQPSCATKGEGIQEGSPVACCIRHTQVTRGSMQIM